MKHEVYVRRIDLIKMNLLLMPKLLQTYIGFGFIISCAAFGGIESIEKHGVLAWLASSIIIGFVIYLVVFFLTILFQAVTATADKGSIGKTIYNLEGDFFIEETQGTETKTRWNSISGLFKFKNYMFVRISRMRIHIIPKREFENPDDFVSFCDNIIQHKSNA